MGRTSRRNSHVAKNKPAPGKTVDNEDLIRELRAENERLQSRTNPNHVILIDGVGHYVNDAVNNAFVRLKTACDKVAEASSYRMDIGAVEACRLASKSIDIPDGPVIQYDGTGNDALRQIAAQSQPNIQT